MSLVPLPQTLVPFLKPYLPTEQENRPFVTLTWAQSLDSRIASAPGLQTKISHPETKTMTHYLRAYHDAILVGIGTVLADDPKLNCRYGNFSKIRPIIVDPHGKWAYSKSTLCSICNDGSAMAPYILIGKDVQPSAEDMAAIEAQKGAFIKIAYGEDSMSNWSVILNTIHGCGLKSVMIEGGAKVINELLRSDLVDSVIITVAPLFLGKDGVEVAPASSVSLTETEWWKGTCDTIVAGRLKPDLGDS